MERDPRIDPRPGDEVGDRTCFSVRGNFILFGQVENGIRNCGAWITDRTEWAHHAGAKVTITDNEIIIG